MPTSTPPPPPSPAPVLVVHARDDHHVPVDYALATAARHGFAVELLPRGGHHVHVALPELWLAAVGPWLAAATAA